MYEIASSNIAAWSNFYTMTGSSAAALTGLMFVVITLVTRDEAAESNEDGIATFSTPTVMHFCAALLVSAIMVAPWRVAVWAGAAAGILGFLGIVYVVRVMHRTTRLQRYTPDVEDWICYTILPFIAYGAILIGGASLSAVTVPGLFFIGAGVIMLIFLGIRNSWDVVTYLATS